MTFDPYVLVKYHLYLLQLENYELGRFWKLLFKRGWFPVKTQRKDLVWTSKAKLIFALAEILILLVGTAYFRHGLYMPFTFVWQRWLGFLGVVYILDFFTPVFLSLAVIVLSPFDYIAKRVIVIRAKSKIKKLSGLKIIAVAGSYGKTTMKEVLGQVLGIRYNVSGTPESVNTPVGIARWILNKVDSSTEVLVVEMGEHYSGDVEDICNITKPEVVVITGINEAHLERMKNLDTVTATIFEAVSHSKPKALVVLNGDDANVVAHYKEYVWPDHQVEQYKVGDLKAKAFNTEKLCWEAEFKGIGKVDVWLLGEYILADVQAAIKIAKNLGMDDEDIKKGISKILPIEHRLQPLKSGSDILVIDDSYNGNPDGVREAIKVLGKFTNRRKVYITPGLVEMGKASEVIHRNIGKQLASVADVVILIKNSVTPWIEEGVLSSRRHSEGVQKAEEFQQQEILRSAQDDAGRRPEIVWFDTAQEAHVNLGKILKPGDVIVFQNDWGDSYL